MWLRRLEIIVVGSALAAFAGYAIWSASWSVREARRWDACLERPLAQCEIPKGYSELYPGCGPAGGCEPALPGVRRYSSTLEEAPSTLWSSIPYAVITVDAGGRVEKVEVERLYASL